jgi:hypothetical protein
MARELRGTMGKHQSPLTREDFLGGFPLPEWKKKMTG